MRYAAMEDALVVAGPDAERVVDLADVSCLAVAPDAPERAFVGTTDGLHRTTDAGASLERVFEGTVTSVAVSPHDPAEVWVGTEPSAVHRSTDAGRTFTERPGLTDLPSADRWAFPPRPDTHHVRWLQPDAHDPDRWYVAVEAGALVRTEDAGETWRDRVEGSARDTHTMAVHADAPGRLYDAAGDGYSESTDGGDGWTWLQDGLDHTYCWSVAVDPADPDHRLVSAASGARRAHSPPGEAYVYRRRGGAPWERVGDGLPTGEGILRHVLVAGPEGAFHALCNRGLFRSADGDAWERVDIPWPDRFGDQVARGLAVV